MEQIFCVSFFKKLVNSDGHPVGACQGVIELHAPDQQRAIEGAWRKFAEATNLSDESIRADYEVEEALPGRKHISASAWTKGLGGQPSRL